MAKPTASIEKIQARFMADDLSRRKALQDALAWAVFVGRRDALESAVSFVHGSKSKAVELHVWRELLAHHRDAKGMWAAFRCHLKDGLDATAQAIGSVLKGLYDAEADARRAAKAKLADEAQRSKDGVYTPATRATRANAGAVIVAELVDEPETPALCAPYKKPASALPCPEIIRLPAPAKVSKAKKPRVAKTARKAA